MLWRKLRALITALRAQLVDPPLDLISAAVFGFWAGRMLVYLTVIVAVISSGIWMLMTVLALVVMVDSYVHGYTLKTLVENMRFQAMSASLVATLGATSLTGQAATR